MLLAVCIMSYAVQGQTSNPYKSINKKSKIVTLTNGKYRETYDDDILQRVGSVLIDTRTKKIVRLLDADSISAAASDNTAASRWISTDPLAHKYPSISPYAFCANNPIMFIDLDGRVIGNPNDPHVKQYKAAMIKTQTGREIWQKMEESTRVISIYSAGKDGDGRTISRHLHSAGSGSAGAGGEVVSQKEYNAILAGQDYNSAADYIFNSKTGLYDKNSNFDNTVIMVDPNSFGSNLVPFILTDQTSYTDEQYGEMGALVVVGEEASHSVQNYADFKNKHKDTKTGKYDEKGGNKPYEKRKNEVEAKKDAANMVNEYKENVTNGESKKDEH